MIVDKEKIMKKNFKPNTWLYPQPVLVIASYGADGTADGTLGGTIWTMERPSAQSGKAGGSGGGCAGANAPAALALVGWLLLRCSRKGR